MKSFRQCICADMQVCMFEFELHSCFISDCDFTVGWWLASFNCGLDWWCLANVFQVSFAIRYCGVKMRGTD